MEALDQMLGKWRLLPDSAENFDAFADALSFPPELKEKMKQEQRIEWTASRDGEDITITLQHGDHSQTLTFRLGQQFKSNYFGMEADNTFTLEGNKLVGEHGFAGQKIKTSRYLQGDRLKVDSEGNGVVTSHTMEKC